MKTKMLIGMLAASGLVFATHAQITVGTVVSNGLAEPCGVTTDPTGNYYIADSVNNRITEFNIGNGATSGFTGTGLAGTNDGPVYQAQFSDPEGVLYATYKGTNGLLVADTGNHTIRLVNLADGFVATLAGTPGVPGANNSANALQASFRYPVSLALNGNNLYIADSGNNAIRVLNLSTLSVTNLVVANNNGFFQPNAVTLDEFNRLWVADTRNNAVKMITLASATNGTVVSTIGGNNFNLSGTNDSVFGNQARFNQPRGLLWLTGIGLIISDTGNNSLRLATNYAAINATNYAVNTFAGTSGVLGYLDGSAQSAEFNSPFGFSTSSLGNQLVVADQGNNALRSIQIGQPVTPPAPPTIGYVTYVPGPLGLESELVSGGPFEFTTNAQIEILAPAGSIIHYTVGHTPSNPLNNTQPTPSLTVGSTPPAYANGMTIAQEEILPSVAGPSPSLGYDITVEAVSIAPGSAPSAVSTARFVFATATPQIVGDNAAQFILQDTTPGAAMYYTTDGSTPTVNSSKVGPSGQLSLDLGNSNVTFNVFATFGSFEPSTVATEIFSPTNFQPNQLSYGFASGEASSQFIGSPGETFYAPVTLSLLPLATMYSLQFNSVVTNVGAAPAVNGTTLDFVSMLEKPNTKIPGTYETIPPAMFTGNINEEVITTNGDGSTTTNFIQVPDTADNPPPANDIIYPFSDSPTTPFVSLVDLNTSEDLIGVGWLERNWTEGTNLYNSQSQDLIEFSQAHDTLFKAENGKVVVGGFNFVIPANAVAGQQYQIQLGRASATSDGVGAPGSDVFIQTPTNNTTGPGAINATKIVTVGQVKYVAGDSYPFGWFNAGDFGDTNLDNADVEQVFQSAIYNADTPPAGSDFFDAMDSCCVPGTSAGNYLVANNGGALQGAGQNPLYDGNDTSINNIAFGDGQLDVSDVYVTFRRSLDPSLNWYERFWTNGVLGAIKIGNEPTSLASPAAGPVPLASNDNSSGSGNGSATNIAAGVNFTAGDAVTGPGQTLQIPITATVFGNYPLRVLMLNLTVEALDGSPAITNQVQFTPNASLGSPTLTDSDSPANYAAAWLNSAIAGLTGEEQIGTLIVTLPPNASTSSAYAVHFDHASGSPNGVSSFPRNIFTGLITLADRSSSSWNDGIPDSWRLRYFGTVSNQLSAASADADGDGVSNYAEYVAGTDPTDPKSYLHVTQQSYAAPQGFNLHWPSTAGKTYIIEASPALFGGTWTPVSTNTGTGGDMYIQNPSGAAHQFYRVLVQ